MENSVLLRIAFIFLILKEVSGIKCKQTMYAECYDKTGKKQVIECLHHAPEDQSKTLKGDVKCIRATYTFEDNSEVVIKSSDKDPEDMCKTTMTSIKRNLEKATEMEVKDFKCDNCNEDNCSDKSAKSGGHKENEANANYCVSHIITSLFIVLILGVYF